tara:strand:- start:979 stop:1704 length:726 start_codon:yes stop_codon:yes gene_type:complete
MKGYVYIARIIDHGGKFVNGYHKIGLSKQYKVRETQLNSTHLPFDVMMVRVFETEDMGKLEGILHVCFEDYRVIKEYDDRRNITTEWFDVSDIDTFHTRLDKMVSYLSVEELDLGISVDNDDTLTDEEKVDVKKKIGRAKSTNLKVMIGDKIFFNKTAKETYVSVINELIGCHSKEQMLESFSSFFKETPDEFRDSLGEFNKVKMVNGLFMSTWGSNITKVKRIKSICDKFKFNDVICEIM